MPTSCPTCLAEFDKPRPPSSKCPECGARLPGDPVEDEEREEDKPRRRPRRRDDDDEEDDRPRRRRRRDDDDSDVDDRPARRRPAKKSGVGKVLLILGGIAVGCVVVCCGGGYLAFKYLLPKPVKTLDATRHKTPDGGTGSVTVNVRIDSGGPGRFVSGDYVFNFKAGGRTSVHNVGLIGQGGGEFRSTFATPELMQEKGPVEFWVERRDGSSVTRVSDYHTIP